MTTEFAIVGLRNFDVGLIATTMKGELINYTVDGGTRQVYAKEIPNLNCGDSIFGNKAPIVFAFPEDVYSTYRLPTYVVTRTSLTPAFDRAPWFGYQRKPTSDALPITVQNPQDSTKSKTGYSKYVSKWNAHPFNIGYDIKVLGRTQAEGQLMLIDALKIFRPPFSHLDYWTVMAIYESMTRAKFQSLKQVNWRMLGIERWVGRSVSRFVVNWTWLQRI